MDGLTPVRPEAQALGHHFYLSSSVGLPDRPALDAILEASRRNNVRDGLSGMLLYQDGAFIQYLEGPAAPLEAALKRIYADRRHRGVIKLTAGPVDRRLFPDWTMGFAGADRLGGEAGGFDLSWRNLDRRMPDGFPDVVRRMMLQVYGATA